VVKKLIDRVGDVVAANGTLKFASGESDGMSTNSNVAAIWFKCDHHLKGFDVRPFCFTGRDDAECKRFVCH